LGKQLVFLEFLVQNTPLEPAPSGFLLGINTQAPSTATNKVSIMLSNLIWNGCRPFAQRSGAKGCFTNNFTHNNYGYSIVGFGYNDRI
jgi:hypothetical protein